MHRTCTNWALAWAHVYISKQFLRCYSKCHRLDTALCNYLMQVRRAIALKLKVDSIIIAINFVK